MLLALRPRNKKALVGHLQNFKRMLSLTQRRGTGNDAFDLHGAMDSSSLSGSDIVTRLSREAAYYSQFVPPEMLTASTA